uniref:Uncharacterized protein n=1 Tax=Arundo donax TaxID=35708 RepID=A0A0A9GFI6_ARUDO
MWLTETTNTINITLLSKLHADNSLLGNCCGL